MSCSPQPLRPQGTVKLSKVWRQLGDKGEILGPKCREGPNGVPQWGASQHRSPDTCLGAPHWCRQNDPEESQQANSPPLPSLPYHPLNPNTPPRAPVTPPLRAGGSPARDGKGALPLTRLGSEAPKPTPLTRARGQELDRLCSRSLGAAEPGAPHGTPAEPLFVLRCRVPVLGARAAQPAPPAARGLTEGV